MNENSNTQQFTVYNYRWIILLLFMFVALMTQVNWITFAPIMNEVAGDYNVETDLILLLTASYMLIYIPMNFPATWAIDKYGLKWGTGIGVILTGLFSLLRAFSGSNFPLLMVAQIMTAVGQPFVLNSFTKLAVNWFPESEKALATGLGTVSILLGVIVGMMVTPFVYANNGIETVLLIYGVFSVISMILYLLFVKNIPEKLPNANAGSKAFDFNGIKDLFKVREFNILLILVFVGLGSFNAISSEIDNIFISFNDQIGAAGLIGGVMIIGGILGAGILSALSDKLVKRKIFLVVATLTSIPLTQFLIWFDSFELVVILAFFFGFFLVSALPIALIYAAEITYPIAEEASNGLMMTLGQIAGILLLIEFNMFIVTFLFVIAFVFSLFLTDIQKQKSIVRN